MSGKNDDNFQQLSFFSTTNETNKEIVEKEPDKQPDSQNFSHEQSRTEPEETTMTESENKLSEQSPESKKKAPAKSSKKSIAHKAEGEEMTAAIEKEPKIDFEASLSELEKVVRELDSEIKLEKALNLFEQGIKLSVQCEQFIKGAEQKIEILKKQADGSLATELFEGQVVSLED
jgi:exodeoxyribonuclease VII small subunit